MSITRFPSRRPKSDQTSNDRNRWPIRDQRCLLDLLGESRGGPVKKLLAPAYWARALSNPLVVVGLIVDLLPLYAVIAWGWNAVPLVMLYWMENIVAGVMTIPRIVVSSLRFGIGGLLGGIFLSAFFVVHYGLF